VKQAVIYAEYRKEALYAVCHYAECLVGNTDSRQDVSIQNDFRQNDTAHRKRIERNKIKSVPSKILGIGQLTRGKSAHTQTFQNFFSPANSDFPK
jgi:hypothetical protein